MSDSHQTTGNLSIELIESVFQDARQSLYRLEKIGVSDINLSDSSLETISQWDTFFDVRPVLQYQGDENADVFIVDEMGQFFEGEAGLLLEKILGAMSLKNEQTFICSLADSGQILSWVEKVRPKMLIALGEKAAQQLLESQRPLTKLRGQFHQFKSFMVMPTHHPSVLLRNPALKREVWDDMKLVMAEIGLSSVKGS